MGYQERKAKMNAFQKMLVGFVFCGVFVMVASTAGAVMDKPAAQKDDVAALKMQVAQLQGKIEVLEQKLSAVPSLSTYISPVPLSTSLLQNEQYAICTPYRLLTWP